MVLTGHEATEAAVKHEAAHVRVLHIATHGFFKNGTCLTPLPGGTRGVGGLVSDDADITNPLQLSGLAFAGANLRADADPERDDGVLLAEEVATLDLTGVEWAVLSACDTGVGAIKAGEGVFGLRRAFQVAGVRTVIMSLWRVEDASTRLWMRALYKRSGSGTSATPRLRFETRRSPCCAPDGLPATTHSRSTGPDSWPPATGANASTPARCRPAGAARRRPPLTPVEVRDSLKAFGVDLMRYTNDIAAVHTTLKRVDDAGELRFVARPGTGEAYVWDLSSRRPVSCTRPIGA